MPNQLIAGNWKMNLDGAGAVALVDGILSGALDSPADLLVCPSASLLRLVADRLTSGPGGVALGGQDCHQAIYGAHTGDVSATMLIDAGCRHVILGHSERRADHGETDALVRAKAATAMTAGLRPIVCVGESLAERESDDAVALVSGQLDCSLPALGGDWPDLDDGPGLDVAYEPVWAIGTGRTATGGDIAAMHAALRDVIAARYGAAGTGVRILYGGSVKPDNAKRILATAAVGGVLVGGASLKASDFKAIASAARTDDARAMS